MSEHPDIEPVVEQPEKVEITKKVAVDTIETNGAVGGKLSSSMISYIVVSAVGGFLSILLMLFGQFDGKISRVISTLALFAIFTFFSSLYLGKSKKSSRSPMIPQLGNVYMLILGLILIWGTLSVFNYHSAILLPMIFLIVILVQIGIFVTDKASDFIQAEQKQLSRAALLTTIGLASTTVLFSLPLGMGEITDFSEGYWRFTIAIVLFTGIMISITSFIAWAFRKTVPTAPVEQNYPAQYAHSQGITPQDTTPRYGMPLAPPVQQPSMPPQNPIAQLLPPAQLQPAPQEAPEQPQYAPPMTPPENPTPMQFKAPVKAPMPWPVFPNGQPIPALSNGRPDFKALQVVSQYFADSEKQFFS